MYANVIYACFVRRAVVASVEDHLTRLIAPASQKYAVVLLVTMHINIAMCMQTSRLSGHRSSR